MPISALPGGHHTPHGAYGFKRTKPGEGQCRHGYPCQHWGLDLTAGPDGDTWVLAPETCTVRYVATDDVTRPLSGYGPGAVLLESASWLSRWLRVWHVLGHLDPATWAGGVPRRGRKYVEGDRIARYRASYGHVHWEVRTAELVPGGDIRGQFTRDPLLWVRSREVLKATAATVAVIGAARLGAG